jgi:environmental stress-induced protein Ves
MSPLSLINCPLIPWRNGAGVTQELFKYGGEPFLLRISIATVSSDDAFSLYPDHNRILFLLNGSLKLTSDSKQLLLPALTPYYFSGEENIHSQLLEGELRDFNIIFRKDLSASIEILVLENTRLILNKDQMLYVLEGVVEYEASTYSETLFFEDACIKIAQRVKVVLIQTNLSNCNKG